MPGKPRVHELAKELGVTSKDVLVKLGELGEYVKGPSSTIDPPVVRRLRQGFLLGAHLPDGRPAPRHNPFGSGAPRPRFAADPRGKKPQPTWSNEWANAMLTYGMSPRDAAQWKDWAAEGGEQIQPDDAGKLHAAGLTPEAVGTCAGYGSASLGLRLIVGNISVEEVIRQILSRKQRP